MALTRKHKICLAAGAVLAVCATVATLAGVLGSQRAGVRSSRTYALGFGGDATCGGTDAVGLTSRDRTASSQVPNLFEELSSAELQAVYDYLLTVPELRLVPTANASVADNVVYLVELLPPTKAAALAYLDGGGALPERQARAVLYLGAGNPAAVEEVVVGPLPAPTRWSALQTISFDSRPPNTPVYARIDELVLEATEVLYPLLVDSFGGYTYHNCTDKCLTYSDTAPRGRRPERRATWIWFMRNVENYFLHPLPLEMHIDHSGNDSSAYSIESIYYGGRLYDSAAELMAEYTANTTMRVVVRTPNATEQQYSSFAPRGLLRGAAANSSSANAAPKPGPRQFEPAGRRFSVDRNRIEYLGWSLQVGARPTAGVRFWDIRFKGERIVYELSIQEAMAAYGGATPSQSMTFYYDSAWLMGTAYRELVHGVDCPHNAVYIDLSFLADADTAVTYKNAMCVFEHNTGMPARRHYDDDYAGGFNYIGGLVDQTLVIRGIATTYNYDYVYDVILHLNGIVEVASTTAGNVQAAYYTAGSANYSYPYWHGAGGSIHNHLMNWKVDLDIVGTNNSFLVERIQVENVTLPWTEGYHLQPRVVHDLAATETGLSFITSGPVIPAIINTDARNSFGSARGYKVQVDRWVPQLLPDDWWMLAPGTWSKYQVAVTQRKESEPVSSQGEYDQSYAGSPSLRFESLLNNESVAGQDLVAWVTVGGFHLPTSEDAPSTTTIGNRFPFFLKPFNYFDGDANTDVATDAYYQSKVTPGAALVTPNDYPAGGACNGVQSMPQMAYNGTY